MSEPTNKDIIDAIDEHRRYAVLESGRIEKNFGKINGRLNDHRGEITKLKVHTATLSTRQKIIGAGVGAVLLGLLGQFFGI